GVIGFLVAVNLMVFVLAFFLDFFEIAFIAVPLLAPVAAELGIDPIWFGVMLAVNMQTAFMHPPFGFALFYLKSVAPKSVRTADIYWGAIPFLLIQLAMVSVVLAFPGVVLREPPPEASSVTEIPIDVDAEGNFLPPEWR
ncbi:MAG TPA: TRAP transporter large permease subunit, partial [Thiobacillaceae bacterium]